MKNNLHLKRFFIAGTNELLTDENGEYVLQGSDRIRKGEKKGDYIYTKADGNSIAVTQYKAVKTRESRARNNVKNKFINLSTKEKLVDSQNQGVFFGDPRIHSFPGTNNKYFFQDFNSNTKIPVARFWAFQKQETARRKAEASQGGEQPAAKRPKTSDTEAVNANPVMQAKAYIQEFKLSSLLNPVAQQNTELSMSESISAITDYVSQSFPNAALNNQIAKPIALIHKQNGEKLTYFFKELPRESDDENQAEADVSLSPRSHF